jgi:type III secretion protein L
VVKAVNQFVGRLDPDQVFEAALLRVDTLIRNEPYVTVRVAPAQEAGVREVLMHLREEAQWSMPISVSADPALPPGACVLQTASGTLDLGVEAQLDVFRRAVQRSGLGAAQ